MTKKYIDITPTWEAAVTILLMVLANDDAPETAKRDAENEILRLARAMDAKNEEAKAAMIGGEDV